jgi:hypothetical protein
MTANTYKVPVKQWKKWNDIAKKTFNITYFNIKACYNTFLHPKTGKITKEEHITIAWNSAWIAADAVTDILK